MRQQKVNRLNGAQDLPVSPSKERIAYLYKSIRETEQRIGDHIDHYSDVKRKRQLLESIPGIGEVTINVVLAEFAKIHKYKNAKCLAAFIGVALREHQSGQIVRGPTRLSKIGRARLRKSFFMPALVALRYGPELMDMKERLSAAGKSKMAIAGAAMRKLVRLIYGVLKSGVPLTRTTHKRRLTAKLVSDADHVAFSVMRSEPACFSSGKIGMTLVVRLLRRCRRERAGNARALILKNGMNAHI